MSVWGKREEGGRKVREIIWKIMMCWFDWFPLIHQPKGCCEPPTQPRWRFSTFPPLIYTFTCIIVRRWLLLLLLLLFLADGFDPLLSPPLPTPLPRPNGRLFKFVVEEKSFTKIFSRFLFFFPGLEKKTKGGKLSRFEAKIEDFEIYFNSLF